MFICENVYSHKMIRKETSTRLADSISNILRVAPTSIDPECSDDCTAKITEGIVEQDEQEETGISKPRRRYVDLQDEMGSRYTGKKGNRKSLDESVEEWTGNDYAELEKYDSPNSDFSDSEESDMHDTSEDKESESHTDDADDDVKSNILYDTNIKQINELDTDTQLQKAACVRNQLNIWENLLEIRIQLQKCLISANRMPQNETFTEIMTQSEKFEEEAHEAQKNIENILSKLLNLQLLLRNNYPETNKLCEIEENGIKGLKNKKRVSTEETSKILTDIESNQVNTENENPCKRMKLWQYEKQIAVHFKAYTPFRNSVIQKWDDKTRVAFTKNNNMTHTIVNQIEYLLNDKHKMIKKTQRKQSNFHEISKRNHEVSDKSGIDTDPEVFDDNDFYHQMLKEFIETKSVDVTDPIKLGKQWVRLQNMRNEIKRKIDTKATKGRKIRYTVHTKLVNFMAPIDYNTTSTEAHLELYNSLFGKGQNNNKLSA